MAKRKPPQVIYVVESLLPGESWTGFFGEHHFTKTEAREDIRKWRTDDPKGTRYRIVRYRRDGEVR